MPTTIKYIGVADNYAELPVTGKQSVWQVGQQEERESAEAALLMETGLFSTPSVPVTATTNPLTGGIEFNGMDITQSIGSRKTACALGDSITADASASGKWTNWGWLTWTRRYLADKIDLHGYRVYAVGGKTAAEVVAEQLPQAVAAKCDIAFVHCGTNSLGSVTTAALIDSIKTIYDTLRSAGTFVVAIPIRAHSGAATLTGDNLLQMTAANRWIADYCRIRSGIQLVDVNPVFVDFSTGNVQSAYLRDGLHDNLLSAKVMGKAVADAISPMLPSFDTRMTHLGDVFDATKNQSGNLLTNGLLAGSGGSLILSGTGVTPTGWRGGKTSAGSTCAVAFSKEANASYTGLTKAVMTFSGTGDGNGGFIDQESASTAFSVGDVVQAECEIDYDFTTGNFIGIYLQAAFSNSGYAVISESWDGYYTPANGLYPTGSGSFILRTDQFTVPTGHAYSNVKVAAYGPSSATAAGVVKVGRVSLRKVF